LLVCGTYISVFLRAHSVRGEQRNTSGEVATQAICLLYKVVLKWVFRKVLLL